MFIDEAKVKFVAGKGGDGCVSWRREKCIPNGGPRGGNGGKGGDVILRANPNENTLSEFRHKKIIRAKGGVAGGTQELAGAMGEDLYIDVPVGTLIKDESEELIYDLSEPWEEYVLCRGGRGGYGNAHFASSTRQAPAFAEMGDEPESKTVILELKLVADIGIIGLPNVGKSTLIKSITNVKPKIADYPFTTIIPNLGVMDHKGKSLVLEDVPGLIEGASDGKGLGHTFLKHIERTRALLHIIDLNSLDNIFEDYRIIRNELEKFSQDLAQKQEVIVLSKADLFDSEMKDYIVTEFMKKIKTRHPIFVISAPAMIGIEELKDYLIKKFENIKIKREDEDDGKKYSNKKIYDLKDFSDPKSFKLKDLGNMEFEISGDRIEQIVRMTNMNNFESQMRVFDILEKIGAIKKIKSLIQKNYTDGLATGFFEGESDSNYKPKIFIAGRTFTLERVLFN